MHDSERGVVVGQKRLRIPVIARVANTGEADSSTDMIGVSQ